MPIKSENRHRYPSRHQWQSLRGAILTRSKNCCEHCGVENNSFRNRKSVHLAVCHLDQQPENNDFSNLAALCQWCHLKHDKPFQILHLRLTVLKRSLAFNLNRDLFGFDFEAIENDYFANKKAA